MVTTPPIDTPNCPISTTKSASTVAKFSKVEKKTFNLGDYKLDFKFDYFLDCFPYTDYYKFDMKAYEDEERYDSGEERESYPRRGGYQQQQQRYRSSSSRV